MTQQTIIKPTIGRIVWFWRDHKALQRQAVNSQPYAALVTYVHSDEVVNLAVFDQNGDLHPKLEVLLWQGGDEEFRPLCEYCEWMPYQKGQAVKAETRPESEAKLEARLAALEAFVHSQTTAKAAVVPPSPTTGSTPTLLGTNSTASTPPQPSK